MAKSFEEPSSMSDEQEFHMEMNNNDILRQIQDSTNIPANPRYTIKDHFPPTPSDAEAKIAAPPRKTNSSDHSTSSTKEAIQDMPHPSLLGYRYASATIDNTTNRKKTVISKSTRKTLTKTKSTPLTLIPTSIIASLIHG
jgi:hypothetical protein